ncbi:MAG: cytochrome c [Vicinamibacterales bacterium]
MMTSRQLNWRSTVALALVVSGVVFMLGCNANVDKPADALATAAPEPTEPAVKSVLSVNEVMVKMMDNAAHVVWDVEKPGCAPKNDADWVEVEDHALQLAATANLIQMGGTGPQDQTWAQQAGWKKDTQDMIASALAVRAAAEKRDLNALIEANGGLVASCESCHKAFKPDSPTEGITHQNPHSDSHSSCN